MMEKETFKASINVILGSCSDLKMVIGTINNRNIRNDLIESVFDIEKEVNSWKKE